MTMKSPQDFIEIRGYLEGHTDTLSNAPVKQYQFTYDSSAWIILFE